MKTIESINTLRKTVREYRSAGESIALVPTMGALHAGHLSLIQIALENADRCIVSIFLNPAQFGPGEDLDSYPRTIESDIKECRAQGADCVFIPSNNEIYPSGFATWIQQSGLPEVLCGASRPGHFRGVLTVVAKLFNIAQPDIAVFGQKDYQQSIIIRRMAADLNFSVKIITAPVVRESDGLAMSSRNVNLTSEHRKQAVILHQSLSFARQAAESGKSPDVIAGVMREMIEEQPDAKVDYIEIRHPFDLTPVDDFSHGAVIAVAVFFGNVRLIDNCLINA